MRLAIFTIFALCLVAGCRCAEEEYEYDDEPVAAPVAPVTPPPSRSAGRLAALSPRSRNPVIGRKPAVAPSTTAKPVEEAVEEEEEAEELEDESFAEEAAPTTTTEAPKKVRGGVRPFRSNEDLLAALKRRRAQAGSSNSIRETPATEAAEPSTPRPKSISSNNSRSRSGQASDTSSRSARGRFGASRPAAKPVQEEVEEETQQEEVQVKPKSYRRG